MFKVTVMMFKDMVESVMLEYDDILDMAWRRCFRRRWGRFRPAT
jgi:hypothetical protein